ncbi:hypothetical protein GJ496_007382 [Pomphorhynchus laevis]|nr:hypothetical protein GJ496_007382 [Pomphorhynchus laevis]
MINAKSNAATNRDIVNDPLELDYLPTSMVRIVRMVVSAFYEEDTCILVDYVLHFPGISEELLTDRICFDLKQVRRITTELWRDKLLSFKMDAEYSRTRFFFINFENFVKVVRYRLDQMRANVDKMAIASAGGCRYICSQCGLTYTDLDADRLFNLDSGSLHCTDCDVELTHNVDDGLKARELTVSFNENLATMFTVLRQLEDIQLESRLTNPNPLPAIDQNVRSALANIGDFQDEISEIPRRNNAEIRVLFEDQGGDLVTQERREYPTWLAYSTIDGQPFIPVLPKQNIKKTITSRSNKDLQKFYEMVFEQEMKINTSHPKLANKNKRKLIENGSKLSSDIPLVTIPKIELDNGKIKRLSEVNKDDFMSMSEDTRREFIRKSRECYIKSYLLPC